MSTTLLRVAILCTALTACARLPQPFQAVPSPPDSSEVINSSATRSWQTIRVSDAYGAFDMRVPVLRISRVPGSSALVIDSMALQQVEKRLTARIARVARAEAAALHGDSLTHPPTPGQRAPAIQPGLLGTISFAVDSVDPSPAGQQRIAAVARLARDLSGPIEIATSVTGTAPASVDGALVRARRVYFELVAAEPALAGREVRFTVEMHTPVPGAAPSAVAVNIFATSQR